jgi:FtsZ-binding cell division protein ZapB
VRGGDMKALATAAGFKLKRDLWVKQYAKGYQISISPPGTNPQVCSVTLDHPVNGITPVIVDVHNWAMGKGWELYRNDQILSDMDRTTRSWEMRGETELEAVRQAHYGAGDRLHLAQGAQAEAALEVSRLEERIRYVVDSRERVQQRLAELRASNAQWAQRQDEARTGLEDVAQRIEQAQEHGELLAAHAEEFLGLGVPGTEFVVGDRPGFGHGGFAGVAEVLPGGEVLGEEALTHHAVEG